MDTKRQSLGRRQFVQAAAVSGLAGLLGADAHGLLQGKTSASQVAAATPKHHFNFDKSYNSEQTRLLLKPANKVTTTGQTFAANSGTRIGLPFYWDDQAKVLVNPYNVQYDPAVGAGMYEFSSTIFNFRASQAELGDVWQKLTNNAQLRITAGGLSPEDDPIKWIIMTGVDIAQKYFSSKDKQLLPLAQNNKPTDEFRPAEKVNFKNGFCTLQMNISAQRKKSFWDKLLQVIKPIVNSSVFGILPVPKLYLDTAKTLTATFDQLASQSSLIPVLTGNAYEFRIYDGTPATDLKFRPGHWVIVDSDFASAHMDSKHNLAGVFLDIPGLQYQLKDSNNQSVDTTYMVCKIGLDKVTPKQ
jgi:hypothetical protein